MKMRRNIINKKKRRRGRRENNGTVGVTGSIKKNVREGGPGRWVPKVFKEGPPVFRDEIYLL